MGLRFTFIEESLSYVPLFTDWNKFSYHILSLYAAKTKLQNKDKIVAALDQIVAKKGGTRWYAKEEIFDRWKTMKGVRCEETHS